MFSYSLRWNFGIGIAWPPAAMLVLACLYYSLLRHAICKLPSRARLFFICPSAFHPGALVAPRFLLELPELYARRQRDQPETKRSVVVRRYPTCIFIHTCVVGTRASSQNLTGAVLLAARFAWEHARRTRSGI